MAQKTPVIVDGEIWSVDWITHDGKAWLVPDWILSPDDRSMKPLRIISLALAEGIKMDLGEAPLEYFRSNPQPKSLLENGVAPPGLEKLYEIREEPEIWLPNPDFSH